MTTALQSACTRVILQKGNQYDESGQKTRYFADDDAVDLDTLVKRTKYGDDMDADLDRTVTNNIMRKQRCVQALLNENAMRLHLPPHGCMRAKTRDRFPLCITLQAQHGLAGQHLRLARLTARLQCSAMRDGASQCVTEQLQCSTMRGSEWQCITQQLQCSTMRESASHSICNAPQCVTVGGSPSHSSCSAPQCVKVRHTASAARFCTYRLSTYMHQRQCTAVRHCASPSIAVLHSASAARSINSTSQYISAVHRSASLRITKHR
eukprot:scaffold155270_cov27-Tisochrysis_lutea.AAC.1